MAATVTSSTYRLSRAGGRAAIRAAPVVRLLLPPTAADFYSNPQMELIPPGMEDVPEHVVDRSMWWVDRD